MSKQFYIPAIISLFAAGFITICIFGIIESANPFDAHRCKILSVHNLTATTALYDVLISNQVASAYGFQEFQVGEIQECLFLSHVCVVSHGRQELVLSITVFVISAIIYGIIFIVNVVTLLSSDCRCGAKYEAIE